MSVSVFLLQGSAAFIFQFLPFILIFGVFYFLIIMPQRKRQQALQEMVSKLKNGDKVVTGSGIIGVIAVVKDGSYVLRTADKTLIEVTPAAIAGMYEEKPKA